MDDNRTIHDIHQFAQSVGWDGNPDTLIKSLKQRFDEGDAAKKEVAQLLQQEKYLVLNLKRLGQDAFYLAEVMGIGSTRAHEMWAKYDPEKTHDQ